MVVLRYLLLMLFCLAPVAATAAEKQACLTPQERNAAIAARKAVPLARAMKVVKARIGGEVVNARLCRQSPATPGAGTAPGTGTAPKGLVYVLTVLARNGKVTQARVDATDGHWLGGS
jgi:uncharacterized membrane protein YkoI